MTKTVLAIDASTTCTGCAIAVIEVDVLMKLSTSAIIPPEFDPTLFCFLPTKRSTAVGKNRKAAWIKFAGERLTVTEDKKRCLEVKMADERHRRGYMASRLNMLIHSVDLILMEGNMSFRSMSVTRMLGEIAGIIQGLGAAHGKVVEKINVHTARAELDITRASIILASKGYSEKWLRQADLTKESIKVLMLSKYSVYGLNENMTTDESDALLILDTWLRQGGIQPNG